MMQNKITDIKQQQKNQSRFSVYVNDKYAFGLSDVDLLRTSLSVGMVLSDSDLNEIRSVSEESKCLEYALSRVQMKMYTEKEIKNKLLRKDFSQDSIMFVLSELKHYGYIDDYLYAQTYAQEVQKKYGILKIKQKLFERGVSSEIIQDVLEDLDNQETAFSVLQTKMCGRPIANEDTPKIIRFLAQRGFPYAQAKKAIDTYMEEHYD